MESEARNVLESSRYNLNVLWIKSTHLQQGSIYKWTTQMRIDIGTERGVALLAFLPTIKGCVLFKYLIMQWHSK